MNLATDRFSCKTHVDFSLTVVVKVCVLLVASSITKPNHRTGSWDVFQGIMLGNMLSTRNGDNQVMNKARGVWRGRVGYACM